MEHSPLWRTWNHCSFHLYCYCIYHTHIQQLSWEQYRFICEPLWFPQQWPSKIRVCFSSHWNALHLLLMTRYMKNNTNPAFPESVFKNSKQLKELNHIHLSPLFLSSHLMICLTWQWIQHYSKVSHQNYSMVSENSFPFIPSLHSSHLIHSWLSLKSNKFKSIPSNLFNSLTLLNTLFVTILLTLQQTTSF